MKKRALTPAQRAELKEKIDAHVRKVAKVKAAPAAGGKKR